MDRNEKKKIIYNLMRGSYELTMLPDEAKTIVESEMSPGHDCEKLYEEVYNANRRLCNRLQVQEDKDIELIITNLLKMGEELSMKMFDYGADIALQSQFDNEEWKLFLDN